MSMDADEFERDSALGFGEDVWFILGSNELSDEEKLTRILKTKESLVHGKEFLDICCEWRYFDGEGKVCENHDD